MSYSSLAHLKPFIMVLTAAIGTVTGTVMVSQFGGTKDPGTFILTLNPAYLSIVQGTTATSTITITSISGFAGTVTLSSSFTSTALNITINPTSLNLPANGAATSTLTVKAGNTLGSYTVIVSGTESSKGKTITASSTPTVQVVSSQDFTINTSPSSITNTMGTSNTTMITVTSVNGYSGNVTLTVTAPFGYLTVTGGQTPLRLVSGGAASSSLTIASSSSTAPGTYNVIVTGTDGSRSHSATIKVTVVDPTPPPVIVESLKMTSYVFNNSTSLTVNLQNTGNGTTTLVSYVIRDSSGDAWSLTNWAGPTIAVGATGSATMLIGSSCPTCIYTGITGLFFQFQAGQTYTVTVTTARNYQTSFTVTYP